ncbi:MAG: AarF/ABC1/UbiB kinase family protein [Chloroflexota bacterium]
MPRLYSRGRQVDVSSLFFLRRTATDIARARRISEVLVRNGLGFLLASLGLAHLAPPWRARRVSADARAATLTVPQRVRRTLEELGPTYIKLGQVLSTRPDLLPPEYIVELSKLLDAAPPVAAEQIRAVVARELDGPVEQFYASFDDAPIASASIGQVHRATLHDGTAVVVKVQRPNVERTVAADLDLLTMQARFLAARSETLRSYGLSELVDEFAHALRGELDYSVEGRNAERLGHAVRDEGVLIPQVYWDLTTRRVITLSALPGIKLSEVDRLRARGYSLGAVAEQIVRIYLKLVFEVGVFHADPHPANILVHEGRIGLVDFGVVGFLTPRIRENLADLLLALVRQNADDMVHVIVRMGATERRADRVGLRRDMQRLIVRYYSASLASVPIAEFLGEMLGVAFRHHVRLPSDLALLARTVVVLEGVARNLDPSFVLAKHLEPFVLQLIRERVSLKRTVLDALTTVRELEATLQVLPRRVDAISEQLEHGDLVLGVDIHRLEQAMRKLDAVSNRLAFSIIVAALVVGSALILAMGERAAAFRIPFTQISLPVAQIGFVVAGLLGAWLLFSIVRSRGL